MVTNQGIVPSIRPELMAEGSIESSANKYFIVIHPRFGSLIIFL